MKKGVFYLAILILVLVAAGAAYAYTQRPARAISNAAQKLSEAQTQHFEAAVTLDNPTATQPLLQGAGTLTVMLNGSFDRRGPSRDSLVTDIILNTQMEGVTLELSGEVRFIDDKAYLLVKKSPAAIPLLVKLKDQWAEFPRGEAGENPAQNIDSPLFSNTQRVGREKVGDKSAVKYEAQASQRAIVGFMDHVAQLLGTRLTADQVNTLRSNLAGVEQLPVTLWITPMTHELVQLETKLGDTGTRYTIKFSERNKPVNHSIPEGAKPINEILQQQQQPSEGE